MVTRGLFLPSEKGTVHLFLSAVHFPHESWHRHVLLLFQNLVELSHVIRDFTSSENHETALSLSALDPYEKELETTLVRAQFNKTKYTSVINRQPLCVDCLMDARDDVLRTAYEVEIFMGKYHIVKPSFKFLKKQVRRLKENHPKAAWNVPKCREGVISTLSV